MFMVTLEGCCIYQQRGGCTYTQLSKLTSATCLSAAQCNNACKSFSDFVVCDSKHFSCLGWWNLKSSCFQADIETDEVYAQMTLQPLSPVCSFAWV